MLPWNGSDVKEIGLRIVGAQENNGVWAVRIGDEKAHIHRYTSDLILLLDEFKPAFGMMKIGRLKATLNGKPVILSQILGEEHYLSIEHHQVLSEDVRRCYLFRWICGLTRHGPKDMVVRSYKGVHYVVSYNEEKLGTDRPLETTILNTWFGKDTNLRDPLIQILYGETYDGLRSRLSAIAIRVAPAHISIVDSIMHRLQEIGAFTS